MAEFKHFTLDESSGVLVVRLTDARLSDTLLISDVEDELLELLEERRPAKLLVDFEGVTHSSTAVINGLLRAKKRLLSCGGQLALCDMRPTIREAYRILNLDGAVFTIYDTRRQALAGMAG